MKRSLALLANLVLLASAVVFFGCSSVPSGSSVSTEETVKARAQQRWDALVAGDVEKAYGLLSPGTRQARSLASYSAMVRKGFWSKAVVEKVECPSADVCKVMVSVEYSFRGSLISSPVWEDWVLSDGRWWATAG